MIKLGMIGLLLGMFLGLGVVQAKAPAKIEWKTPPVENRVRWEGVVERLRRNPRVNAQVEELAIEPLTAENSTRAHPTFRANLFLKCTGAAQAKKLRANPSGMRVGVFERWILRAIQQRCR